MTTNARVMVFAAVLAIVCSALLAGVSALTEPARTANERADAVRNILAALGADVPENAGATRLLDVYERTVREVRRDGLTLYEYAPSGTVQAVAVPIQGAGLWGPIEGVVALEPDLTTIRGVRFYKQQETPGLGGEISSKRFEQQFDGKRLVSAQGTPGFRIVKPDGPTGVNVVDGITGATLTSDRVQTIMDRLARNLAKVR